MARKGYLSSTFTLPDGTRKYVYAKTKKELEEKVLKLKIELSYGVDLKDDTLLSDLVQLWFSTDVKDKVTKRTEEQMKGQLNTHLMPLIAGYKAKQVTPLQVKMWLNETGKLNKHSAQVCFRALKQAFNLAEENGLIAKSPVLPRYKAGGKDSKTKEALTPAEEAALLSVLDGMDQRVFVWFLLATGARRGEALALKWDCVDLDNAVVHLKRNLVWLPDGSFEVTETMKTSTSRRAVPIPYDLADELRERKSTTTSLFVFPDQHGDAQNVGPFSGYWQKVQRRFGPTANTGKGFSVYKSRAKLTPHVLRHTFATRCFEAGMDIKEVQYLMGHTDPNLTLSIYTHYCIESRQETTFEKVRNARSGVHECTTPVPHDTVKQPLKMLKNVVQA